MQFTANTEVAAGHHAVSGGLLARNAVWNLLGTTLPILVAVVSMPPLARALGADQLGVLTLCWAVIGYFGIFDFGLGRAVTKLVAEKIGAGEIDVVGPLFWTCLWIMTAIGCIGAAVAYCMAPVLVHRVLNVPPSIQQEALASCRLLALGIPCVITTTAFRGLLEAQQRFKLATILRLPIGILTYLGPLMVLPFSSHLTFITSTLVLIRICSLLAHLIAVLVTTPQLREQFGFHPNQVAPLLRFGSWMTLSNVVIPLMSTADRFIIGSILTMSAVAYYATANELITRILILPNALFAVLFPAFATSFVLDHARAIRLFKSSVKLLVSALFPVALVLVTFAHEGLRLWLGQDFANYGSHVLQWMAIGMLFNAIAYVPAAAIQGIGKPKWTGILQAIEAPFYVMSMWLLIKRFGVEGAAIAWTARVVIDAVILFIMASRLMKNAPLRVPKAFGAGVCLLLAFAMTPMGVLGKVTFSFLGVLVFGALVWFLLLEESDRRFVARSITTLRKASVFDFSEKELTYEESR